MPPLFKTSEGKERVLALYDQKLESLGIDYRSKLVDTSYGQTHYLVTGDPTNPPLVIVHGSNACAPISLETYPRLSTQYQVFAVDVPGQPTKSEEVRLRMQDESYGKWLHEVLVSLDLEKVILVGFSLGGLIILKTLLHQEDRIQAVYLASPAFIVNGNPLKAMLKIFLPMRTYMRTKKVRYVEKFLNELFTDRDPFGVQFLSQVFLHFSMDFSMVPIIKKGEAAGIRTPITLFGAKKDLVFPGEKMLKRANKILPSLQKAILLEQSKHVQGRSDNDMIEQTILKGIYNGH